MQTPVGDSGIFTEVSRSAQVSSSPRWSPEISRKGQVFNRVTVWIAPGLFHTQMGSRCAFQQVSPEPLLIVFTIKLLGEPPYVLFPSIHGGSHTTNTVGVVSQD
jgi:hypothetical protein